MLILWCQCPQQLYTSLSFALFLVTICLLAFAVLQVETLAEAGSYEDALSLCAMCKVRVFVIWCLIVGNPLTTPMFATPLEVNVFSTRLGLRLKSRDRMVSVRQ